VASQRICAVLAADQSRLPKQHALLCSKVLESPALQQTGGSSTVRTPTKLRVAGAVARETLKAAAAKRSGVAVADIRTQSGHVILPDGTKIPYVELSEKPRRFRRCRM